VAHEDWAMLKSLMHKLKGSAGSYGFQQISDFAVLIEDNIDQGNQQQAKQQIANLQDCMQQLFAETQELCV